MSVLEIFGTFASLVIAVSLMLKNLKRFRMLNLAGSVLFALYGLGIKSLPVFLVNVFIVLIDVWYLHHLRLERSAFSLLHVNLGDSEYLKEFLCFHEKDIARHVPTFSPQKAEGASAVFVLRDMVPTSLVIYRTRGDGVFDIILDYATPAFRDYRSAEFFFKAAADDIAHGVQSRFYERSSVLIHEKYLKHIGFVTSDAPSADGSGEREYVKSVRP